MLDSHFFLLYVYNRMTQYIFFPMKLPAIPLVKSISQGKGVVQIQS